MSHEPKLFVANGDFLDRWHPLHFHSACLISLNEMMIYVSMPRYRYTSVWHTFE